MASTAPLTDTLTIAPLCRVLHHWLTPWPLRHRRTRASHGATKVDIAPLSGTPPLWRVVHLWKTLTTAPLWRVLRLWGRYSASGASRAPFTDKITTAPLGRLLRRGWVVHHRQTRLPLRRRLIRLNCTFSKQARTWKWPDNKCLKSNSYSTIKCLESLLDNLVASSSNCAIFRKQIFLILQKFIKVFSW